MTARWPGRLVVWTMLALMPLAGAARDRVDFPGDAPPPPPEPNPVTVAVPRGGTVWITLSAYSLTSPIIRYRIKRPPKGGQLGTPQLVTASTGTVRYKPPAGAGPGEDSFAYAVQSLAGVSAPAEVRIKITDKDPLLVAPNDVEFGGALPGETVRRSLTLQNIGGGLAEGTLRVPEGWSIEGDPGYRLGAGEKQNFAVDFTPAEVRDYTGDVEYTGNPERATDLNGQGLAPIAVTSGTVELRESGRMRIGTIYVENRTAGVQTLRLTAGPRLETDATTDVPAKGSAEIVVRGKGGDGEIVDRVTVEGEGLKTDVPVHWAPAPVAEIEPQATPAGLPGASPAPAAGAPRLSQAASPVTPPAGMPDGTSFTWMSLQPLAPDGEDAAGPVTGIPVVPLGIEGVRESAAIVTCIFKVAAAGYRVETETVVLDAQHRIEAKWLPFADAKTEVKGTSFRAEMHNLQPGAQYVVRLVGLDGNGEVIETSSVGLVWTPMAMKRWNWAWAALGVVAVAGGVGTWVWRKRLR